METLEVNGVTFRVVRNNRRTVCMRVGTDGMCEVLAPRRIDDKQLCEIAVPYTERLQKQQLDVLEAILAREKFTLNYGDEVRFLGDKRTVEAGEEGKIGYDETSFFIPPHLDSKGIRQAVIQTYKLAAKTHITARVNELTPRLGCEVKSIKINTATSHWASCSKKNTLNFSMFCIMASQNALDYIIIHELCHMHEFNHSKKFWALVSQHCPNYKQYKIELANLCTEIKKENWQ